MIKNANLLLMNYPQYTGGKFIMNCLSMSRHVIPPSISAYHHLKDHPNDYSYRLERALSTLPGSNDTMTKWLSYEDNTSDFYGKGLVSLNDVIEEILTELADPNIISDTRTMIEDIASKKMTFFNETPGYELQYLFMHFKIFPNVKVLQFKNFKKFHSIAITAKTNIDRLKTDDQYFGNYCKDAYDVLKGPNWPEWDEFEKMYYNPLNISASQEVVNDMLQFYREWPDIKPENLHQIDVDNTFFNKQLFFEEIKNLYHWLNFDDFDADRIEPYYDEYINLHQAS